MISKPKQQIVGGFNRREADSILWISNRFLPEMISLAVKITNDSMEANDLVADAFVKLLEHTNRFGSIKEIRGYWYNTTKNYVLNFITRQKKLKMQTAEKFDVNDSFEEEFELANSQAVFRNAVYQSIEQLPAKTKSIFQLYYYDNLSNEEISKRLGIPEKTVANQRTIAGKKLKIDLKEKYKMGYFLLSIFL
jgi:RNA polymerase sigma factor (sigma-70 family)